MRDIPDAPWTTDTGYWSARNKFYGRISDEEMSMLYDYDPDRCDGHECRMDCDICPWQSTLAEEEEPDGDEL